MDGGRVEASARYYHIFVFLIARYIHHQGWYSPAFQFVCSLRQPSQPGRLSVDGGKYRRIPYSSEGNTPGRTCYCCNTLLLILYTLCLMLIHPGLADGEGLGLRHGTGFGKLHDQSRLATPGVSGHCGCFSGDWGEFIQLINVRRGNWVTVEWVKILI